MWNKLKNLDKSKKILIYTILGVILLFFLWWIIAAIINSTLFPSPIQVFPAFFSYLGKGYTYQAIGGTFLRLLISFLISLFFGALLGILSGYFYRLEAILKPLIVFLRTLPTAAVVLILIVLLKPVWTPIIVSSLMMFPLFYQAFLDGVKNINKDLSEEMKMDGVNPKNSFFKVYIPVISPYILLAMIQSLGLGMKVSIMAEILAGSNSVAGLGRLIQVQYLDANATNVMALSLIAIFIIVIIDIAFHFIKKGFKNKNHGQHKN